MNETLTESPASNHTEGSLTDAELLDRIRAGDPTACAACVDLHAASLYRLALRMMGSPEEAEDVVQETFLSAFKAIDSFEGRSELGTWLYRIAYNTALMRLRKKQPLFVSIDGPAAGETEEPSTPLALFDWCCLPDRDFETAEARSQLEAAIAGLPDGLRAVFVLRALEGLSTEETAEVLDISVANVKTRLHRARLRLRELLAVYFTELAEQYGENLNA